MAERTCTECGRPGPVELEMKTKTGQVLTMISCSGCESRTWRADGEPVPAETALSIAAGDPAFRVTPSRRPARR